MGGNTLINLDSGEIGDLDLRMGRFAISAKAGHFAICQRPVSGDKLGTPSRPRCAANLSPTVSRAHCMSLHILLVEDDRQLARQLSAQLKQFGHEVVAVEDGQAAVSSVAQNVFDAIVLDWMLPTLDGLAVIRQLRASGMTLPILMLTALGQTFDKVEGLDTGADDYMVKPADATELNARLNALVRARRAATNAGTNDTIHAGDIVISPSKFRAWRNGRAIDLALTEFKLLFELARDAGAVVTKPMLLERVWGYDFIPTTNIVEAHVRRLRQKLMQHGDDPISNVRGVGYSIRQ
jgi:two-component system OmpR family response regulator